MKKEIHEKRRFTRVDRTKPKSVLPVERNIEYTKELAEKYRRVYENDLTVLHNRFVSEYLIDFNAKQAAIRAGYSMNTALRASDNLLRNPDIVAEIAKRKEQIKLEESITSGRVLREMAKLAFSNMDDYTDKNPDGTLTTNFRNTTRSQMAAVSEVVTEEDKDGNRRTRVKLADKKAALDSLGRNLGLFEKDNAQQQRKQNINVVVQLVE